MSLSICELQEHAFNIRVKLVETLAHAGSGHLGGSLGLADVFTALYFHQLKNNPLNPNWEKRDRLILSIGHVAPILYTTLAYAGYFSVDELKTLRQLNSRLQGHPGLCEGLPGVETSSGSLGQGLSIGLGMALALRYDNSNAKVYTIHGDGELQEGMIWEAAMAAGVHKVSNLVSIVDRNKLQIDGSTADVMDIEPLADKWRAFNWEVYSCNGNNMKDIISTFDKIDFNLPKPKVIIANTKMGAGVTSIENNNNWHGKVPSVEQNVNFINELNQQFKR